MTVIQKFGCLTTLFGDYIQMELLVNHSLARAVQKFQGFYKKASTNNELVNGFSNVKETVEIYNVVFTLAVPFYWKLRLQIETGQSKVYD